MKCVSKRRIDINEHEVRIKNMSASKAERLVNTTNDKIKTGCKLQPQATKERILGVSAKSGMVSKMSMSALPNGQNYIPAFKFS